MKLDRSVRGWMIGTGRVMYKLGKVQSCVFCDPTLENLSAVQEITWSLMLSAFRVVNRQI